jgi:enoyl-CoA hydratase
MTGQPYSFLRIERDGGVATVTFDRPANANRWEPAEEWELSDVVDKLSDAEDVRVVILTGAGETFCCGVNHNNERCDANDFHRRYTRLFGAWIRFDKPVVVALNGTALGVGLSLALLGDIIIADRQVHFHDAHITAGAISATGSFLWPQAVGLIKAKQYILTGTPITAEEAARIGLISEMVETGECLNRARVLAAQLATARPSAVQGTKRALNQWLRLATDQVLQPALALEFMALPNQALDYGTGE